MSYATNGLTLWIGPRARLGDELAALTRRPEFAPVLLVLSIVAASIGLDAYVGLKWNVRDSDLLLPLLLAAPLYGLCLRFRGARVVGEIALYLALYFAFSLAAVRLTYLGFAAGFPLRDAFFARADASLGFDWTAWEQYLHAHPLLLDALDRAYKSHGWQAPVAIVVLAIFDSRNGNAFLLTSLCLGAIVTAAIFAVFPAIGPAEAHGWGFPGAHVLHVLRTAPTSESLPLVGIIAFPSFHTVMAVCYTCAYRRLKLALLPAAALNVFMLAAVPFSGNHYLVDVFGGIVVAVGALKAADVVLRWIAVPAKPEPATDAPAGVVR